ncbi:Apoptotic chromatin condensation inducer in the nucleus [Dissophora globulifera]|nr:Apoptotic chromatin condensation inducer in the nucleus [Dissophora globulifera]
MIDANALKVTELKAELTARGLSTKGLKKELVARLEDALASEGTTNAPAESTSEPDVAPKEVASGVEVPAEPVTQSTPTTTESEAQEIVKISQPMAEPVVAADEAGIVMAAVPEPAMPEEVKSTSHTALEPVTGTPSLSQEGLIDTVMTSSSGITSKSSLPNESKKRSLDSDGSLNQQDSTFTSSSTAKESPAKRLKAIEINREQSDKIAAAAKQSVEADTRRRSAAPSPSPAPGRAITTTSVPDITPVSEEGSTATLSAPSSPNDDRKTGAAAAGRRFDARSMMERQIKLAALDRQPDANAKSASAETKESPHKDTVAPATPLPSDTTRSLTITNFVRPLTVNQVKRMLTEFGEIEALWMDSIRTHCYVTFKEQEAAEKAYTQVKGQVFPKETGKPLEPYFITSEAATKSIEAAEEAQKSGKRPVIYTGQEPLTTVPKLGTSIGIRSDDIEGMYFWHCSV